MSSFRSLALGAFTTALAFTPAALVAQHENEPMLAPPGWKWALDAPARLHNGGKFTPADSTFDFVRMPPGWHVTMGPGATLWDPRERAEGRFSVQGEMVLFPGSSANEYGVFVGGRDVAGTNDRWTAFVVRSDGSAAVIRRAGSSTQLLMPWTKHAAVTPLAEGNTVQNVVAVRAEPDSVRFFVNGERVAAFARADISPDGPFGFRVGKGVNLHATNLDLTRRLAPSPAR